MKNACSEGYEEGLDANTCRFLLNSSESAFRGGRGFPFFLSKRNLEAVALKSYRTIFSDESRTLLSFYRSELHNEGLRVSHNPACLPRSVFRHREISINTEISDSKARYDGERNARWAVNFNDIVYQEGANDICRNGEWINYPVSNEEIHVTRFSESNRNKLRARVIPSKTCRICVSGDEQELRWTRHCNEKRKEEKKTRERE